MNNKHLKVIFETVMPSLENSGIEYWVYGGIALAAVQGHFYRNNEDVDIFVNECAFENAVEVFKNIEEVTGLGVKTDIRTLKRDGFERPKVELKKGKKELLSIVPMFEVGESYVLVFGNGSKKYNRNLVNRVERRISGYRFITPPNESIKKIFQDCLPSRINSKSKIKVKQDAQNILSTEEFNGYYPNVTN
ncbi:hypothetical protein GF360_01585 [candidate division WWE3 bacterium]|nr:hypothetical protein [candidate division WWE3 bacterium]